MIDTNLNKEAIGRVCEVRDKLKGTDLTPKEETKLMFEQLLRGLSLTC